MRGVPVGVRGAVFVVSCCKVELHLVGEVGRNVRYQVVIQRMAWVSCDGGQLALGELYIVNLVVLIKLERNVVGLYQS